MHVCVTVALWIHSYAISSGGAYQTILENSLAEVSWNVFMSLGQKRKSNYCWRSIFSFNIFTLRVNDANAKCINSAEQIMRVPNRCWFSPRREIFSKIDRIRFKKMLHEIGNFSDLFSRIEMKHLTQLSKRQIKRNDKRGEQHKTALIVLTS